MAVDPRHLGWLEKIFVEAWASLKAHVYVMFHLSCDYRMESTYRRTGEEQIRFIGVVKHHKGVTKVVKTYYGRSVLPLLR